MIVFKQLFWTESKYRYYRIALIFFFLVALSEISIRLYFSRRGIIDRNPGNTTASMPYLFEQLSRATHPRIVFIGSSVTQGYGNCPDGKHFPALIEKELRKTPRYKKARVFNLSSAGNRFGDHFANMVEASRHKPDLIAMAIHPKMFSVHASLVNPVNHDEVLYYFRDDPQFDRGGPQDLTKRFRLSNERYRQIWLDAQMKKLSGLYRYRRLLGYLILNTHNFPAAQAADRLKAFLGMTDPLLVEAADTTHSERNADYLWKVIPEHIVQLQYAHCEAFDFSDENLNWQTFKNVCEYAAEQNLNLMFYINGLNKDFADAKQFFNWSEVIPLFRQRVAEVTARYKISTIDYTGRVDYKYYSDLDHLNMNGHEQVAKYMLPFVIKNLNRE